MKLKKDTAVALTGPLHSPLCSPHQPPSPVEFRFLFLFSFSVTIFRWIWPCGVPIKYLFSVGFYSTNATGLRKLFWHPASGKPNSAEATKLQSVYLGSGGTEWWLSHRAEAAYTRVLWFVSRGLCLSNEIFLGPGQRAVQKDRQRSRGPNPGWRDFEGQNWMQSSIRTVTVLPLPSHSLVYWLEKQTGTSTCRSE